MPRTKNFCKQEVLDKAMELFWTKGFHATSISDLVTHLGINRASLYDTYGGKQQLFDQAFENYRTVNMNRVKDFLNQHDSVKEGFYNLFEQAIDQTLSDKDHKGCFVVNVTTEMSPADETLQNVLIQHKKQVELVFYNFLEKGQESGELNPTKDLKSIAALLLTLYNGLMVVAKIDADKSQLISSVDAGLSVLD
ncbi:MAG: TetR/AcrR family transcriptional regulator [Bacteroidota bacterium]